MLFQLGISILADKALQHQAGLRLLASLDSPLALQDANLEEEALGIQLEAGGRPYFSDRHADFSISHSGLLCAAAYTKGPAGFPLRVGCDVQIISKTKRYCAIAQSFYYPRELQYISAAPDREEENRRFVSLWVLKESYIKLWGLSIFNIRDAPEFLFSEHGISCIPKVETANTLRFYLWALQLPPGDSYYLACIRENAESNLGEDPEFIFLPWGLSKTIRITSVFCR